MSLSSEFLFAVLKVGEEELHYHRASHTECRKSLEKDNTTVSRLRKKKENSNMGCLALNSDTF